MTLEAEGLKQAVRDGLEERLVRQSRHYSQLMVGGKTLAYVRPGEAVAMGAAAELVEELDERLGGTVRNYLLLLVGLPMSGKTRRARQLGVPVVCPDAIRLALHGERYRPSAEPMVWTMARYMAMSLFLAGHRLLVVDATNISRARREAWRSPLWTCVWEKMDATREECRIRAAQKNDRLIDDVIVRMAGEFEDIGHEEAPYGLGCVHEWNVLYAKMRAEEPRDTDGEREEEGESDERA